MPVTDSDLITRIAVDPQFLRARVFRPVTLFFLALTIGCGVFVALFGGVIPVWLQYLPFAASLLLFGLPHGALDQFVPSRLRGRPATIRSVSAVVVLYAVLGSAVFLLWSVAPILAFALFIAGTWFHWGQGDLYILSSLEAPAYLASRLRRSLVVVIRGGLPMLIPLLAAPDVYHRVMINAAGIFAPPGDTSSVGQTSALRAIDFVFEPSARLVLGTAFVLTVAVYLALASPRNPTPALRGAWRRDVVEILLLATFFAIVPAVLAIGLYFCLWHAIRHIVRLQLLHRPSRAALSQRRIRPALLWFMRDSALVTGIALGLLVALYFIFMPAHTLPATGSRTDSDASGSLLGLYLVLISALTLPHTVIVSFMDHRQKTAVSSVPKIR